MSADNCGTRRVVVLLDVPVENALTDVETDLRHYFAGVVSVAEAASPTTPERIGE